MTDAKAEYKVAIDDGKPASSPPSTTQGPSIVAPSIFTLSPAMRAALPIASYCFASILMTVTNKYVVSGYGFNMNFLLLTVQVRYSNTSQNGLLNDIVEFGDSSTLAVLQVLKFDQVSRL